MLDPSSSNDTSFETLSATIFWHLGTCTNSTLSNSWVRCFVSWRYFCILSSFASYSPLICSITSFESFLSLSPVSIPSYSVSLLVAENFSWTPYLSTSPSGVAMTTPTPLLFWADEPSICIVHHSTSLVRLSLSGKVNLVMKSARACALMVVLGWYSMSNWPSSIAH